MGFPITVGADACAWDAMREAGLRWAMLVCALCQARADSTEYMGMPAALCLVMVDGANPSTRPMAACDIGLPTSSLPFTITSSPFIVNYFTIHHS
jgi:hypothetical protein